MSFATFKQKPISSKVVLTEFGSSDAHRVFVNVEPGIWRYDYHISAEVSCAYEQGAFCYGPYEGAFSGAVSNGKPPGAIISVRVDGVSYSEVTTMANLRATDESFMWDGEVVWIHFTGFLPPWAFSSIVLGMQINVSNRAGDYGGLHYRSRLRDCGVLSVETDPMFNGILGYGGGQVKIRNEDGEFDGMAAINLYGQAIRIRYGEEGAAIADFALQHGGIIEDFIIDEENLSLDINDERKRFARSVPPAVFDLATYPYLKPENVNRRVPLAYGYCDDVEVVCTNEQEVAPSYYHFKLCYTAYHAIKALDAVRVEGVAKTPVNVSLAAGTFDLAAADYSPGNEVRADLQGYESGGTLIQNALEILKDLLAYFGGIAYTSDNYDQTEYAAALAEAPDIQLFVPDTETIETIVGRICVSLDGVVFPKASGKLTFRYLHRPVSVLETIPRREFSAPEVSFPSKQFASTVVIGYDHDYGEDKDLLHVDDSREIDMISVFGISRRYEIQTLLNELADAQTLATRLLDQYAQIPLAVKVTVPISHVELELLDDVSIQIDRVRKVWLGWVTMRVYGITRDLLRGQVGLTLRKRLS